MKARLFLFNALTICSLGMAALATQAVTHQSAQAEPRGGADARDLMQRVMDLEDRQHQTDADFNLVDQSLNDLDFRVNENMVRGLANKRAIQSMQKRLQGAMELIDLQQAQYDMLVEKLADGRLKEAR